MTLTLILSQPNALLGFYDKNVFLNSSSVKEFSAKIVEICSLCALNLLLEGGSLANRAYIDKKFNEYI